MGKYYITTPIFYVNDKPHVGTAYTMIMSDILARWHRLNGDDVLFLTGTDEHGEKVAKSAAAAKVEPKQFVDSIVVQFVEAWKALNISNDKFIRTTDPVHEQTVKDFLKKIYETGDIYKGQYEGWYCVPDETFITEMQLVDGKCPICGREVKMIKEDSYFFKLSKYQDKLLELYQKNPEFLSPEWRSKEIINRVKDGLKDLSITRPNLKWGIESPMDKNATIYVWVDALINYLSAIGWPDAKSDKWWPADVHIVGKEINWFHSVIWPAMLMSAGVKIPERVFAHGWLTIEGKKMSKSLGNAINPLDLKAKYGVDALRYFMAREMPFGDDGDFSEKAIIARINGELVDDLGNLVYRVLTLAERFKGDIHGTPELDKGFDINKIIGLMEDLDTFGALNEIWNNIRAANKYINDNKVWELKDEMMANALYNLLESLRVTSILLSPFIPETSEKIMRQIGAPNQDIRHCKFLEFRGKITKEGHLFEKIK